MGKGVRGRRIRIGGKKEVTVLQIHFQVGRLVHNDIKLLQYQYFTDKKKQKLVEEKEMNLKWS